MGLFSFNGQSASDPSAPVGLSQYMAQGQLGINPGPQMVAASSPIAAAGKAALGQAFPYAQMGNMAAMRNYMGQPNAAQGMQQTSPMSTQNQMANLLAPPQSQGMTW